MTIENLQVGDKINNLSSTNTYEKVTDIQIENGKTVIYTKEYFKNNSVLVSNNKVNWTLSHLQKRIENNDHISIENYN